MRGANGHFFNEEQLDAYEYVMSGVTDIAKCSMLALPGLMERHLGLRYEIAMEAARALRARMVCDNGRIEVRDTRGGDDVVWVREGDSNG